MTADQFGSELRAKRAAANLSQEALALAIGVNRRVIGELEGGKGTVRLEIALAAAEAVGERPASPRRSCRGSCARSSSTG